MTIDRKDVDVTLPFPGYDERLGRKYDTVEGYAGIGLREFPDHLWIEPRDWKDVAEQQVEHKTRPRDYWTHFTNQNPTHECVTHAFSQVMEIAWNRQNHTTDHCVWFSPLSIYAEANPRIRGGTYLQKVLGIGMQRGILPEHHGPAGLNTQKDRFEHTLHQTAGNDRERGGPWVPLDRFPSGWKQTARHFKPLEIINISSWEQIICCLLNGFAVSVGRKGHSIPYYDVIWEGRDLYDDLLVPYPDSYDVERYDSLRTVKGAVGGAYSIITTTRPDDPTEPAG